MLVRDRSYTRAPKSLLLGDRSKPLQWRKGNIGIQMQLLFYEGTSSIRHAFRHASSIWASSQLLYCLRQNPSNMSCSRHESSSRQGFMSPDFILISRPHFVYFQSRPSWDQVFKLQGEVTQLFERGTPAISKSESTQSNCEWL